MAKKKKQNEIDAFTENEAPVTVQPITETLEKNYMPYAMSVIISRAIPEIDGFKPSHRKILYTMYKMGLLKSGKIKSANIVGQTMQLNPHGDAAIYETLVRLTSGHETLLHPFIESKGAFGKHYSADPPAASRYTEAKLAPFCQELFGGIDKDAVDFIPNYDNTTTEPVLLPTAFPNILLSPNLGIAVGMASSICSFNLNELCDGTIALLKNPGASLDRILDIIKAPDFPGGAEIIYDREQMRRIYETGSGSFKMRSKYEYNKKESRIDVTEIPYSSSVENIIKKAREMIKGGMLREVTDIRDATDLSGLRISIELKKDINPEIVMKKLFTKTELENTFGCNFNVLIDGTPRLLGVREILLEWIKFRMKCVTRELTFELGKKEDKLHLLLGLASILLDIDKAIKIIRNTEKEEDVVPNLSSAFNLSKVQAEYVADIKLRNINREYILNRIKEIDALRKDIEETKAIINDELKVKAHIITSLQRIKKAYGQPRRTQLIGIEDVEVPEKEELFFENYNCRLVLTRGGYFKKLSVQSARMADEHKLKEGDFIIYEEDTDNRGDVLFFTDKGQIYRARVADFDLCKASSMGEYIPAKLSMDDGEHVVGCKMIYDIIPEHHMIYIFENGKGVRVPMSVYEAKTRRKKISGAYSTASPLAGAIYEDKTKLIFIRSEAGKGMLIQSSKIPPKATRTASGVQVMEFPRKKGKVDLVTDRIEELGEDAQKCRKNVIPSTGVSLSQLTFKF